MKLTPNEIKQLARGKRAFIPLSPYDKKASEDNKAPMVRGKIVDNIMTWKEFNEFRKSKKKNNKARVGVFLKENLIRVDIDDMEGIENYVKSRLPETLIFNTRRGYHLYFKVKSLKGFKKGDYILYNQIKCEIIPSLEKGYAILPYNDPNRSVYNNAEIAELPLEWSPQKKIKKETPAILPIREGGRDEAIFKIACVLKDRFSDSNILHDINKYAVYPSLDIAVVEDKWKSAENYSNNYNADLEDFGIVNEKGWLIHSKAADYIIDQNDILVVKEGKVFMFILWNSENNYWQIKADTEVKDLVYAMLYGAFKTPENVKKIVTLIQDDARIRCSWDRFNPNTHLVPFKNKVYNVLTDEFEDHSIRNYNTYCIPYDINEDSPIVSIGKSYFYKNFLRDTSNDKYDIRMLMEYAAYCFVPDQHLKCSLFLTGPTNTGKSIYIKSLQYMLGGKHVTSSVSLANIDGRFKSYKMFGKLLNEDADGEAENLKKISAFKRMTGGESLLYEEKGQPTFEYYPFAKNIFSFNELPYQTSDTTDAYYGRMRVAEFNTVLKYTNDQVVNHIIPSIVELIPWLVRVVLPKIYNNKLYESPNSKRITTDLFEAADPVQYVLNNHVVEAPGSYVVKKDLYDLYEDYCLEENLTSVRYNVFLNKLRGKHLKTKRIVVGNSRPEVFADIKLIKRGK